MTIDAKALLAQVDLAAVVLARMDLTRRGAEWVGLCPFHGESTPSFTVNPAKGFFHCFGCGAHGDAIDFLREHDGLDFKSACAELGRPLEDATEAPRKVRPPAPPKWISSMPPRSVPPPNLETRDLGKPTRSFILRDHHGDLIGIVARYPHPDSPGKKIVLTYSWGRYANEDTERWEKKGFSRPRPLYGLDRLAIARAKRDKPQVILLEGEGKADSAQALFPASVGMSWLGGADGVVHNDYTPLRGLQVVLIPDNDEPGRKAVAWLREYLIGIGCEVRLISPEPDRAKGWNLDDAEREGWTPTQALEWARLRLKETAQKAADVPQEAPIRGKPDLRIVGNTALQEDPDDDDDEELAARFSEMALTEQFKLQHGKDWRFIDRTNTWLEWREDGWHVDQTRKVRAVCEHITKEIAASEAAVHLSVSAHRSLCSAKMVNSMVTLASADQRIASSPDSWDRDAYMLGVPGGAVDLREGKFILAERDDYITKRCSVAPHKNEPKLWLAHLHKALSGNLELIGFLKRYLGMMLTGDTKEHCLLFLYGTGRNGKGTILETVIGILGDYGYAAPVNLIMESKTERHPVELAMLRGKRGVSCSEPPQGARWDDGRIRWLTGGDTITARGMGEEFSSFTPTHHLVVMGNHKPKLRSVDVATKARFNMLNFSVNMTLEPDFDKDLPFKLRAEWPSILNWMVEGCIEWQSSGLARPKCISDATADYLQAEHVIEQWLDECCTRGDSVMDPVASCYTSYCKWCERTGEHQKSRRAFLDELYSIPGIEPKATSQARMVKGLLLKPGEKPSGMWG